MEFGITLPTKADSWRVAKRAEELGFSHAWFYDTALLNAEIFVAMGAAAVTTSRIKLCTGVLTPSNRLAPVAASGLASLNALAPGRIICGVGTGFSGRRTLGLGPMTLRHLEDYVVAIERLLRGETIAWSMEGQTHKTRLMTPERGIVSLADPILVHISAFGPKGRALTAKLGAGWLNSMSTPEGEAAALADMKAAWQRESHNASSLHATINGGGCVLKPGESPGSARVLAQAGPCAAVAFHSLVEQEAFGGVWNHDFPFQRELKAYRDIYKSYEPADERHLANHRGHLMFLRPEETHVTGDVIMATTLTGPVEALVERVRTMKEAGYHQLALTMPPGQEHEMMEDWMKVLEKV